MTLTAADVAEIMRLVEQSSFDELTLEIDGVKLALRRGAGIASAHADGATSMGATVGAGAGPAGGGAAAATTASPNATRASASAANPSANQGTSPITAATVAGASSASPATSAQPPNDPNIHDVPSPLLGTFYRAPKPGAPPFVEVGSQVEENTVVAIIEVMKLMNTVRAGVRGTVTEILVSDGALAEYGESLFRVRKAG